MNERKKILLIGSCGFLLSNFLRKNLFAKDNNNYYIGIDKLTEQHSFYNRYIHKNYKFYVGDIIDIGFLENIFKLEQPNIIIFGAGSSDDVLSAQIKLIGLNNIIQLNYKYPIEKLIYLSSDKIYECNYSNNEEDKLDENADIAPITFQSSIEWACERLLIEYQAQLKCNILRLSNIIGQRQNINNFTAKAINSFLMNKNLFINRSTHEFDLLSIDDFCSALNLSITNVSPRIYNITSGVMISELMVANEICNHLNSDRNLIKLFDQSLERDYLCRYNTSSKRFQEDYNWKPNQNWQEAVAQMCQWALANKWYYCRD